MARKRKRKLAEAKQDAMFNWQLFSLAHRNRSETKARRGQSSRGYQTHVERGVARRERSRNELLPDVSGGSTWPTGLNKEDLERDAE